jgi:DNA-binding CsgD family transcriptional regulator
MAAYGAHLYGPAGRALPAFSEGAMWAFAAAVTLTRRRHPDRPVWHLRAGTAVFAGFGAALNFAHGLTLSGPVTGTVMALVSVAGVTAHQLTTAGPRRPRRTRAERDADQIARQIRKREMQARTEAVKGAIVRLAADGTARLEFPAPEAAEAVAEADTTAPTPRAPKRSPRPAAAGKQAPRTDTETRIARLRARHPELTGPQIADRLGISPRTVRRYPATQASA